ncbi:MAG: glycyl-radical enzyme activating protein [Elusimicrobiales bacterium]
MPKGLIFDIQGFSVHDGPGCRTVFFLSGCPLRCRWCANPEGMSGAPALLHFASRCAGDMLCAAACPANAVSAGPVFDRAACAKCRSFDCVKACRSGALKTAGREVSVDEIIRIIRRDRDFWGPGGGITLSGGEPLFQKEFSLAVLRWCRENGVHTAVETCAFAPEKDFMELAANCDWVFADIKHMDAQKHKAGTGQTNETILSNIRRLARGRHERRLVIRLPLIPGYNDGEDNLAACADFMAVAGLGEINILPFHAMGLSKYKQLGMVCGYADTAPCGAKELSRAAELFTVRNIACHSGPDTPF